jgi:hypothetical protein
VHHDKFATGNNSTSGTSGKFTASVIDTGGKLPPATLIYTGGAPYFLGLGRRSFMKKESLDTVPVGLRLMIV